MTSEDLRELVEKGSIRPVEIVPAGPEWQDPQAQAEREGLARAEDRKSVV